MNLYRDLNITQEPAWHLAHRPREAFGRSGDAYGHEVVKHGAGVLFGTDGKKLRYCDLIADIGLKSGARV